MSPTSAPSGRGDRDSALHLLRAWSKASGRRGDDVQVPQSFLMDSNTGQPPLARIVRDGRGEVRLGVYLCLLLRAVQKPHDVRNNPVPAAWARMLCLPDPSGRGARRVTSAFKWLEREGLLTLTPRAGSTPKVQLLDPAGSGQEFDLDGRWAAVPVEVWQLGWLFELPVTSMAVLLCLLHLQYKVEDQLDARFIPPHQRASYGFSGDTWTRGEADLKRRGLLVVERQPIGDTYHYDRLRNTYWVKKDRLYHPPA